MFSPLSGCSAPLLRLPRDGKSPPPNQLYLLMPHSFEKSMQSIQCDNDAFFYISFSILLLGVAQCSHTSAFPLHLFAVLP